MTKKELLKAGVKMVVGCGVSCIITNAVTFTTPVLAVSMIKKFCIGAGSFALSAMVSDKTTEYTDGKIDEAIEEIKKFMDEGEKDKKEETKEDGR